MIDEIETLFPLNKGISIQSECPIGLIGDDIEAVAKKNKLNTAKWLCLFVVKAFAVYRNPRSPHCERRRARWVIGNRDGDESFPTTPYDIAIIGDYNIGGDAWSSRILFEEMGFARCGSVVWRRHYF